jgi:hypothetical protein
VTSGLGSQIDLAALVPRAAAKTAAASPDKEAQVAGPTLRSVVTPPPAPPTDPEGATSGEEAPQREVTAAQLFANFPTTKSEE